MITNNILRYLMSDNLSLEDYCSGKRVEFDDICRHLMLLAREKDYHIPDSMYMLMREKYIRTKMSLPMLLSIGIYEYAGDYLEMRGNVVYVKSEMFNEWQMQLCWWSPLVLKSVLIAMSTPVVNEVTKYMHQYILPNFKYTALPNPYIIQMENAKKEMNGFAEEHLHLNGALETDIVWQDILREPDKIYNEVEKTYVRDDKIREMFDQLLPNTTPSSLLGNWSEARNLRCQLLNLIFDKNAQDSIPNGYEHPLCSILGQNGDDVPPMMCEAMLMVMVFQNLLQNRKNEALACVFHKYLLILGKTNKLLVQNNRTYGFREFQKYTSVGLREYSEAHYRRRYQQMAGNDRNNFRYIEGRFSPKDAKKKNEDILESITESFDFPNAQLSLIAHFIKEPDGRNSNIRHEKFRNKIRQRAEVLCEMLRDQHPLAKRIVGIDAAANELDAGPETFAEVYAMAREAGIKHFTFHAGEDFYHIISGLRSIYEAISFLKLKRGDRIGHAVACGIDPQLWFENMGESILMRKGDYMDSLLVMRELISEEGMNDKQLIEKIPLIERRIVQLAYEIYEEDVGIAALVEAWKLRGQIPNDILEKEEEECTREEKLLKRYHSMYYREAYDNIMEINTLEIFDLRDLERLQLILLTKMHREEIVIETLPTSNVLIGHHHNFSSYHIYRWFRWQLDGKPIPPIVVGSDDAGIFATNIYNEYCHIYTLLVFEHKETYQDTMNFIRWLDNNARNYKFGETN